MRLKVKGRWIVLVFICVVSVPIWICGTSLVRWMQNARIEGLFVTTERIVMLYSNHSKLQKEQLQTLVSMTKNLETFVDDQTQKPRPNALRKGDRSTLQGTLVHQKFDFQLIADKHRDLCDGNPEFIIFVHSHVANSNKRETIRQTWASQAITLGGIVLFILGTDSKYTTAIRHEHQESGDILQYDFPDDYKNLVFKSVMSLHFAKNLNCSTLDYIVKTDDDVMLNLKRIKDILKSLKNHTHLLLGSEASNNKVQRVGKWKVPQSVYPHVDFPVHLSGAAYVLSMYTVYKFAVLSERVRVLSIEDVFITGILAEEAGIQPIARQDFPSWLRRGPRAECDYVRGWMVGLHGCTTGMMKKLWNELSSGAAC